MPEQQPFSPSLPHFPAQHAAAVLSLPQLSLLQSSLQHEAAVLSLSFFMQAMASLPPLDFASFPAQHEAISLPGAARILAAAGLRVLPGAARGHLLAVCGLHVALHVMTRAAGVCILRVGCGHLVTTPTLRLVRGRGALLRCGRCGLG